MSFIPRKMVSRNDHLIEALVHDPDYDVRPDGTIWTLICKTGKRSVKGIWREAGYISAYNAKTGKSYRKLKYHYKKLPFHRIMYRKFIGPLSEELVINHIDGDGTNNKRENLEMVTVGENNLHRFRTLGHPAIIGNFKISFEIADSVRADQKLGMTNRQLREKYGLSKANISYIVNNKIWVRPSPRPGS